MKFVTYDGKSLMDFGVYVSGKGTFQAPQRSAEYIQIPGRNGDLVIDGGRFENVVVPYDGFIVRDFHKNFAGLRAFLLSTSAYRRLEDSWNPNEFRLASVTDGLNPDLTQRNQEGTFTLNFNCKPQRFLKEGELECDFTESGMIFNPTLYASKPLLRIYGIGSVSLNGSAVRILEADAYTDVDCDTMNAYKGTENRNQYVEFLNDSIELDAGENPILLNNGISKLTITPRWWTI